MKMSKNLIALTILTIYSTTVCLADTPKKNSLAGISIGQPANEVEKFLKESLPDCEFTIGNYRPDSSGQTPIGQIESKQYDFDSPCYKSQVERFKFHTDYRIGFVHSSVDSTSPVKEIHIARYYNEEAQSQPITVKELIDRLISEYGKPNSKEFKPENRSSNYKKTKDIKYKATLFWSNKGKNPIECIKTRCKGESLEVNISAKGHTYVLTEKEAIVSNVFIELYSHDLNSKHFQDWQYKKENEDRERSLSF